MSNHISLKGAVALVSGANRGIGAAFVSGCWKRARCTSTRQRATHTR
jgi:NAD(P)-dependent dehydrogenase (short-subunit alcohol dehydrogenase family)